MRYSECSTSSPIQPRKVPCSESPRRSAWLELGLVGAAAGHQEADVADALDHAGEGVEGQLKALLVDEPPDQQHEPLVGFGKLARSAARSPDGRSSARVDAVGDHRDPPLVDPEDVGDVPAHVVGAHDHRVGPLGHPELDPVDMGLRLILHPALVAAVLGRVDGGHVGHLEPVGQRGGAPSPRASRGRGRGRRSAPRRGPPRPPACPRSCAPPRPRSGPGPAASRARGRGGRSPTRPPRG